MFHSTGTVLRHLWSLAIEEQFYLVWPPVFLVVIRFRRPALATVTLAAASATLMYLVYRPVDPSRAYYGTDTHAHGLLLGAALAFVTIRPSKWLSVAGIVAAELGCPTRVASARDPPRPHLAPHAVYSSAARRRGLPMFDLSPVVNPGGRRYRWDSVHFTEAGADVAGAAIIHWIEGLYRLRA